MDHFIVGSMVDSLDRIATSFQANVDQLRGFAALVESAPDKDLALLAVRVPNLILATLSTGGIIGAAESAISAAHQIVEG